MYLLGSSFDVQFNFLPHLEDRYICKRMYNITPAYGMILPNEEVQISVKCDIDIRCAQVWKERANQ